MTEPVSCPECDHPLHGPTCRHCGHEQPEPTPTGGWLNHCRQILATTPTPTRMDHQAP